MNQSFIKCYQIRIDAIYNIRTLNIAAGLDVVHCLQETGESIQMKGLAVLASLIILVIHLSSKPPPSRNQQASTSKTLFLVLFFFSCLLVFSSFFIKTFFLSSIIIPPFPSPIPISYAYRILQAYRRSDFPRPFRVSPTCPLPLIPASATTASPAPNLLSPSSGLRKLYLFNIL